MSRKTKLPVPRISSAKFTSENSADTNHVFLYTHCEEPPFMKAVTGWKIIGHGSAPWPKGDSDFAVMFEKETPAEKYGGYRGEEMEEGSQIWMHYNPEWLTWKE